MHQVMTHVQKRVKAVRDYRLQSKRAQTKKAAERPQHFGTEIISAGDSLLMPKVSSERRRYIPMGMVGPDDFCSDLEIGRASCREGVSVAGGGKAHGGGGGRRRTV